MEGALDSLSAGGSGTSDRRTGQARLSLRMPNTEQMHSAASFTHLVAQALGSYLGLAATEDPGGIMGPDSHADSVSKGPSPRELEQVRQIQQTRTLLAASAQKRVPVILPRAVFAVDRAEIDGGNVQRGDKAHYVFKVKNTGDAPLEIDAKPNCGCTVASFDKIIQPGAEGRIEADLNTSAFRGHVQKTIDVKSNDLDRPQLNLRLTANVLSVLQILPSENLVIGLKSSSPTVKELEVRTTGKDPIQVTRAVCSSPYAVARIEPMADTGQGRAYKLSLTVNQEAPFGRFAFLVTVYTSSPREPMVNITVVCDKGILAVPQSVYMGVLTPATVVPMTQAITLSSGEGAFQVRKVESDDPKLTVKSEPVPGTAQYRLTVTYLGGWPAGAVRSKIHIETDDPKQPTLDIPVVANVLGTTGAGR